MHFYIWLISLLQWKLSDAFIFVHLSGRNCGFEMNYVRFWQHITIAAATVAELSNKRPERVETQSSSTQKLEGKELITSIARVLKMESGCLWAKSGVNICNVSPRLKAWEDKKGPRSDANVPLGLVRNHMLLFWTAKFTTVYQQCTTICFEYVQRHFTTIVGLNIQAYN